MFFGNNPGGLATIPATVPGSIQLGFPGIDGVLRDGTADYARIRQQPTALPAVSDPRVAELERALRQCGFAVQRVTDMDGWLAYHAAFVACVTAALYRCGSDPARLAADRHCLTLMCDAVTEGPVLQRPGPGTGQGSGPGIFTDEMDLIRRVISGQLDRLADPQARRALVIELFRQLSALDFETLCASPGWRTCLALYATLLSLADGGRRDQDDTRRGRS
jgi:hypothetical protein